MDVMSSSAAPSSALRVAIVGAGAIGLDLAAALIEGGARVALLARGANLEALEGQGLRVRSAEGQLHCIDPQRFESADEAERLGPRDVVFLTLKSGLIDALWPSLAPLLGPDTTVVSAMNGLPRWLAHDRPAIVRHLDSSGIRERDPYPGLAPEQFVAAIVNRNAARPEPGLVERMGGEGLVLGELHGHIGPRLRTLAQLDRERYHIELSSHIERAMWHKLMINAAFNPLSVLCEQTLDVMVTTPTLSERLAAVIEEVHALGCALELVEPDSFDLEACFERFATRRKGAITSMLRDYQAQRVLELDRIVRAPLWLASRPSLAHPMPSLARLLSEVEDKAGRLARAQTTPSL